MPDTAGDLANVAIKVIGALNATYLRLDKSADDAVITDSVLIQLIKDYIQTNPKTYDCDTLSNMYNYCMPKVKSETVTIGCDTVAGVTDNGDGTYTWTHDLGILEPNLVMFAPYPVINSDANAITFAAECVGVVTLIIESLGATDCRNMQSGGGGVPITADNGLHVHDGVAHLGGTLIENTTIQKDDTVSLHIIHSSDGGKIFTDTYWDSDGALYTEAINDNNGTSTKYEQSGDLIVLSANQGLSYVGVESLAKTVKIVYSLSNEFKFIISNNQGLSVNKIGMSLTMLDINGECDWRLPQYPRVTRSERLAITTTDISQMVFQTDGTQIGLHYWDGTQWNYLPSVPSI